MKTQVLLVTGGAGFIGSNFIHYILDKYPNYLVINYDLLTYAGNLDNLTTLKNDPRYYFVKGDIQNKDLLSYLIKSYKVEFLINFAAESHVDRAILNPTAFVQTNILGTQTILELIKTNHIQRFLQISTDEVYGSLGNTGFVTEENSLAPRSVYAASKASADHLVLASYHTFALPVVITRCSNNYGPFQFPEKLIPLMIINAFKDKPLPVYGDGLNIRDWLHVQDHVKAIDLILHKGKTGEVYNIGANNEKRNIDIVKLILKALNKPETLIQFVKDRPGHDWRYAVNAGKISSELGFAPSIQFEKGLQQTIDWYLGHESWWQKL